ncbi:MAG: polymer-forming cytoskeletal protein [Anaerolineales bacterium]|nr:polymer-forming cytoskeletal protein [Anaerolineales bacterium]
MFKKRDEIPETANLPASTTRVTSVLGSGIAWKGAINGSGGVRVEGAFDGDINLRGGMLVVGQTGRVTCEHVRANVVIVAGALRGDITAEKIEIRSTGRVWGDVVTAAFSTEEGAFLRGQIRMEESIELGLPTDVDADMDAEAGTEQQAEPEED